MTARASAWVVFPSALQRLLKVRILLDETNSEVESFTASGDVSDETVREAVEKANVWQLSVPGRSKQMRSVRCRSVASTPPLALVQGQFVVDASDVRIVPQDTPRYDPPDGRIWWSVDLFGEPIGGEFPLLGTRTFAAEREALDYLDRVATSGAVLKDVGPVEGVWAAVMSRHEVTTWSFRASEPRRAPEPFENIRGPDVHPQIRALADSMQPVRVDLASEVNQRRSERALRAAFEILAAAARVDPVDVYFDLDQSAFAVGVVERCRRSAVGDELDTVQLAQILQAACDTSERASLVKFTLVAGVRQLVREDHDAARDAASSIKGLQIDGLSATDIQVVAGAARDAGGSEGISRSV